MSKVGCASMREDKEAFAIVPVSRVNEKNKSFRSWKAGNYKFDNFEQQKLLHNLYSTLTIDFWLYRPTECWFNRSKT